MAFGGAVKLTGESDYRKALKAITQDLKEVSSQMKVVSSAYDKGDKSAAALSAKSEVLNQKLAKQKEQLSLLKSQYANLSSQYDQQTSKHNQLVASYDKEKSKLEQIGKELGTNSKEYKEQKAKVEDLAQEVKRSTDNQEANKKAMSNLRIEMNKSQTEINNTTKEIKDLDKGLEETGKEAGKVGVNLDDLSSVAKGVGTAMAAVAAAVVAVGAAMIKVATDIGDYADTIITMSKVTGISLDSLQAYNYSAELLDVSLDTLTGTMSRNIRSMDSAAKGSKEYAAAYAQLGISVTDVNGHLRDGETVYWEAIDALGKMTNETERDALAMKLFGRSAQDLNPLILAGSENVKELTDEAKRMGAVLSDDQLNGAGAFDDAVERIKSGAEAAKNAIGTLFLPGLTNIAEEGRSLLGEFTTGILESGGDIGKLGDLISTTLQKAFTAIIEKLPGFTEKLKDTITNGIPSLLSSLTSTFSTIGSQLVNMMISSIPEGTKVGTEMVKTILTNVSKVLTDGLGMLLDLIPTAIESMASYQANIYSVLLSVVTSIVKSLPGLVLKLSKAVPGAIKGILTAIQEQIPLFVAEAKNLLIAIEEVLPEIIPSLISEVENVIDVLVRGLADTAPILLDAAVELLGALIKAFPIITQQVAMGGADLIASLISVVLGNLPVFGEACVKLLMQLVKAIPIVAIELTKNLPSILLAIVEGFFAPFWGIIKGAVWGVIDYAANLWTAVKNIFSSVPEWFFGILKPILEFDKKLWDSIVSGAKGAWEGIKKAFSTVSTWFRDTFAQAWENVKNVFSVGGRIFDGIKEGLEKAFKSVVNVIIRGINTIVSKPFENLNAVLKKLKSIQILGTSPFGFIKTLGIPQIPQLAKGGVLARGQIGLLEGNGAEAVVPLEKNTKWVKRVAEEMRLANVSTVNGDARMQTNEREFSSMVAAFKDALSEMKIELDDQVAGRFVEKTVARAVYSY